MNVLTKKIVLCAIVLFLTQSVCAMWDLGSRTKGSMWDLDSLIKARVRDLGPRAGEIYNEEYFQELEGRSEQNVEEDQGNVEEDEEIGYRRNPAIEEAMKNPQEYKEEAKKPNGKTLPRTSRKNFKRVNVEGK